MMRHDLQATYLNIALRPLGREHIQAIRIWRNDPKNSRFLTPIKHISEQMQQDWFNAYLENDDEVTFAIIETELLGELVGSLSLYHFTDDSCEIGRIMVGHPEAHGRKVGLNAVTAALDVAFGKLSLNRISLRVFAANTAAIHVYEQAGFMRTGTSTEDGEIHFEITRSQYELTRSTGVRFVEFSQHGDDRGHLVVAEELSTAIPFSIKRVFYIYGSDADVIRGQHANRKSEFVLINVAGTSKVKVRDGNDVEAVLELNRPHIGIYLPPMVWKDMYDFSEDSVLLVLASEHYDPNEYIRDYESFTAQAKAARTEML